MKPRLLALAALALLLAAACSDGGGEGPSSSPTAATSPEPTALATPQPAGATPEPQGAPPTGIGSDIEANLFLNGSFESQQAPWFSLATTAWGPPMKVTSEDAHSGASSALLELRGPTEATGPKIWGAVQEVAVAAFPELLSGYYKVTSWERGTPKQYVQFVVIAFGVENLTQGFPNYQIRYPLAGISEPPFVITNAAFLFVGTEEPVVGEWVYFERPIADDFLQAWGAVPEGDLLLRVLFETRYDDKQAGEVAAGDVLFDDLYLGPAGANPNRPGGEPGQ